MCTKYRWMGNSSGRKKSKESELDKIYKRADLGSKRSEKSETFDL